jgi:DNA-binding transcriptional ArsR family regulator
VRTRTVEQAAAWLEQVGLALLFPNGDYVLPSLWQAVAGPVPLEWAVRDEEGSFVSFTPEMEVVWRWKDELPARKLACVGLHVARTSSLVAPALVGAVYALTGRAGRPDDFREAGLDGLELELAETALALGRPTTRRELRLLAGAEKRHVDRAVNSLQRKLVLTNAGLADEPGWASTLHDLFARRWRARLRRLPGRDEAVRTLAAAVVRGARDVSAADLAAALRVRRREASNALEALEAAGLARARRDGEALVFSPAPASVAPGRARSGRSRAAGSRSSPRRSR